MKRSPALLWRILLLLLFIAISQNGTLAEVPSGTLQPNDLLLNQSGTISIYSGTDGTFKGDLVSRDVGTLADSWGLTIGPDGNLYICDYFSDSVKRYNGTTGLYIDDFVISGSGGLAAPVGLAFLPDGNLYVADNGETGVRRYNGVTGAYIDTPITADTPNLGYPQCLVYGADGNLYVSTYGTNAILRYNPITRVTETFVQPGDGGQGSARQFAFGPDGNLYVTSQETNSVKRYSGTDGHYIDDFVAPGSGGISNSLGMAFGPDGNLYVSSGTNPDDDMVARFDGKTGAFLDIFSQDGCTYMLFNKGITQTGSGVHVAPISTTSLTFNTVTSPGQTTVTPLNSDSTNVPANFKVGPSSGGIATFFKIESTVPAADIAQGVELSITYLPEDFPNGAPLLLHDPADNGSWSDNATLAWINKYGSNVTRTVNGNTINIVNGVDTVNHKVYGYVTSFSPFAIVQRLSYAWSGVLQPINTDGTSVFKQGSTIPVKFALKGADASVTNLSAKLYVSQQDTVEPTSVNEASSTAAADSGSTFRYDASAKQYVFNLGTKSLTSGTWYQRIDLGDGTNHVVNIRLKK